MCNTERTLRHAVAHRLPVCVVISKMDRLITELKLPPTDAYHKIRHTLEEINTVLESCGSDVTLVTPRPPPARRCLYKLGWFASRRAGGL